MYQKLFSKIQEAVEERLEKQTRLPMLLHPEGADLSTQIEYLSEEEYEKRLDRQMRRYRRSLNDL